MTTEIIKADTQELCERILQFCEEIGQIKCYFYQREFLLRVIESIVIGDGEEICALFSRQSGKSESIGILVAGLLVLLPKLAQFMPSLEKFKKGLWVGIFAPVYSQGSTTYDRIRLKLKSQHGEMILADEDLDEKVFEKKGVLLELAGGSLARVQSGSKQSRVESKTYHIIVVEEAQDIDEDVVTRKIHPMGAAVNATVLKIGTCGIHKGDFYKACVRTKQSSTQKGAKQNYFFYPYEICQKANPNYAKYIEKEKSRLGTDSDSFRMAYKLEWLLERGMFFTQGQLEGLINKEYDYEQESKKGLQVAGIDFGKQHDSTVVTILDLNTEDADEEGNCQKRILNWLEIEGDDYESQYQRIVDFLSQYKGLQIVCCDNTGVGQPIVDRLDKDTEVSAQVVGVNLNLSKRSDLFVYLQQEMLAKRITIPGHRDAKRTLKWQRFCNQIVDVVKEYKGRFMVVEAPKIRDAHDDFIYSLCLACWASKEEVMPEIESFSKNEFL